jgi:hypothetical protein
MFSVGSFTIQSMLSVASNSVVVSSIVISNADQSTTHQGVHSGAQAKSAYCPLEVDAMRFVKKPSLQIRGCTLTCLDCCDALEHAA